MLQSLPHSFNTLIVGASRGIGLGLSAALSADPRAGDILCACRRPERATDLQQLAARDCRMRALRMDVSDEQTLVDAVQEVERFSGELHLVIVTVGVLHDDDGMAPERRLAELDPEQATRSWRVNALGPALVLKHIHALMPRSGRAVFVSLSARVGSIGDNRLGGWYAYRAGKAAQNQLIRTAAIELRRRNREMVCATLHPGTVDTDLSRPYRANLGSRRVFAVDDAGRRLLGVVDGLRPEHSGGFYAWDGSAIPW